VTCAATNCSGVTQLGANFPAKRPYWKPAPKWRKASQVMRYVTGATSSWT